MRLREQHQAEQHHADHATLLLVADGEAAAKQTAAVRRHLETCWDCRARMAAIETTISDFVVARRAVLDPVLPPAQGPRAQLKAQIALAASSAPSSFWSRLSGLARPAYFSSGVAAVTLVAFLSFTVLTPAVSAKEFLLRASAAQSAAGTRSRKVRFRLHGREVTKPDARAREILAAARLDADNPLNAARFASWHDNLPARTDKVTRWNGQLTLLTQPSGADLVQQASLTVEETTWLPVSETVVLRDGRDIEITTASTALEASAAVTIPEIPAPVSGVENPASPTVDPSALADAEVMARVALHRAGAGDGAQIEFSAGPASTISIRTTVESDERRNDLLAALSGIPHLQPEIMTVAEAAAKSSALEKPAAASQPSAPALEAELASLFPNAQERAQFVASVLSVSQRASAEAWELQLLLRRYSDRDIALLSPASRHALEELIRAHVAALSGAAHETAGALKPLIAVPEPAESPAIPWRGALPPVLEKALALHAGILEALNASSGTKTPEQLQTSIITNLEFIQRGLAGCRREIDSHFLTGL